MELDEFRRTYYSRHILDKREMPRCNWYPICNTFHLVPEETSMIVISEKGVKYFGPLRKEDENNEKV